MSALKPSPAKPGRPSPAYSLSGSRPLRYVVVGTFNTLCSFGMYCLGIWAGAQVWAASLASLIGGILLSFLTQGSLVFGGLSRAAFVRFVANWSVMYALYVAIVYLLSFLGLNAYAGGAVATGVVTTASYFMLRDRVFKPAARERS